MDLKLTNCRHAYTGHGLFADEPNQNQQRACLVADSGHGPLACVIREELKFIAYGYDVAPLGHDGRTSCRGSTSTTRTTTPAVVTA